MKRLAALSLLFCLVPGPLARAQGPVHATGARAHEIAWAAEQAGLDSQPLPGGGTSFQAGLLICYEPPQLSDEDPPKCVVGAGPSDPRRRTFTGWQASSLLEALVHAGAQVDQQLTRLWVKVSKLKVATDGSPEGSTADFNDLIESLPSAP